MAYRRSDGTTIARAIYTPAERDKLFAKLHEAGYKWSAGQSLVEHHELVNVYLPCDVYINTAKKSVSYASSCVNGEFKRTRIYSIKLNLTKNLKFVIIIE